MDREQLQALSLGGEISGQQALIGKAEITAVTHNDVIQHQDPHQLAAFTKPTGNTQIFIGRLRIA